MNIIAPDTLAEALAAWMLDAPPIAHTFPDPVTMTEVRIRGTGTWPTTLIDKTPHDIVGVTPSGWLSIAGAGWHRFLGTAADFASIAAACNAAQIVAMADRALFDCALHCQAERPETGRVGGLEFMETEDGRRWVRVDDINCFKVKAAFQGRLAAEGGKNMLRIRYNLGAHKIDETYAGADAWWLFARTWPERSHTT